MTEWACQATLGDMLIPVFTFKINALRAFLPVAAAGEREGCLAVMKAGLQLTPGHS